jgi:hypothetical protein
MTCSHGLLEVEARRQLLCAGEEHIAGDQICPLGRIANDKTDCFAILPAFPNLIADIPGSRTAVSRAPSCSGSSHEEAVACASPCRANRLAVEN